MPRTPRAVDIDRSTPHARTFAYTIRVRIVATARRIALEIAEAPLTTLRATKLMVKRAWELMGMRAHLQWSNDMLTVCTAHTDVREQIQRTIAEVMRTRGPK